MTTKIGTRSMSVTAGPAISCQGLPGASKDPSCSLSTSLLKKNSARLVGKMSAWGFGQNKSSDDDDDDDNDDDDDANDDDGDCNVYYDENDQKTFKYHNS